MATGGYLLTQSGGSVNQSDGMTITQSSDDVVLTLKANASQTTPIVQITNNADIPFITAGPNGSFSVTPIALDGPPFAGFAFTIGAHIYNDSDTAASGTAPVWTATSFDQPTLTATNGNVTTSDAATVYISSEPLASTNQTITNSYSLWIGTGNSRFGSPLLVDNYTDTTGPSTASSQGALFVGSDNVLYYRPQSDGTAQSLLSGWTNASPIVHTTTTTDKVNVGGGAVDMGKLAVDGQSDEIQLLVQGNATQTANIVVFEKSDGTDLFTLTNDGAATLLGQADMPTLTVQNDSIDMTVLSSVSTLNNAITSGVLLDVNAIASDVSAAHMGSLGQFYLDRTLASLGTYVDMGNNVFIQRNYTTNNADANLTDSGAALGISVIGTQTLGTLTMNTMGIVVTMAGVSTSARTMYLSGAPVEIADTRLLTAKGADVVSANDISLGNDGNFFDITGTTQINTIDVTGWNAGSLIVLQFDASATVKHATAGTGAQLNLSGSIDFSATAGDTLVLVYDGTVWREVSRTVI